LSKWLREHYKIATVAATVLLIAVTAAVVLITEQKTKLSPLKIIPENVDIQVKNVVYTDVGSEGTKWEVRADLGTYHRKENRALFEKVNVKLVLSDGRTFLMTGDKAVLGTESKNMDVEGHVTIKSNDGDTITMDKISYKDGDKTFRTDSAVLYENQRMNLQGKGMNLSLVKKELKLLAAVRAVIKPER